MTRSPLGLFRGDEDPEEIANAIMGALARIKDTAAMTTSDSPRDPDGHRPQRLDPEGGHPSRDPYSRENLIQAQIDRIHQMAVFGLTEEDFGDEAIWILDDDGNYITDIDDMED